MRIIRSRTAFRLQAELVAPLILILAAALRFYRLAGQSLWADEGNSVALARRSFGEIAQRTAFDIHPPLYYWLLKIWITVFGDSEIGLRSLSVVLGIGVVYVIGVLGTRLFSSRVGLIAAFLAALSPFQIYYSQEARMYMLLTLLGSLTVLATLLILENYQASGRTNPLLAGVYVLAVTAGLYTHYAYPLILIVVNIAALFHFSFQLAIFNLQFSTPALRPPGRTGAKVRHSQFLNWLGFQIIPLLLYLPWLPIAWRQVSTWPAEKSAASLISILETISVSLLFGLSWPYNFKSFVAGALGLVLLISLWFDAKTVRHEVQYATPNRLHAVRFTLLWLWFVLPVFLTVVIFSPAFLKFLLVATPPLALLLAMVIEKLPLTPNQRAKNSVSVSTFYASRFNLAGYLTRGTLLAILASASTLALYHYYADSAFARDNYRGIVSFIKTVGSPQDAIILNAEGQQDVFNYYFEQSPPASLPVYPLPRQRPLDEAATLTDLQHIEDTANNVYAVYWATQQADPAGVIEGWLNQHLFKATDQWYGNVRLVSYGNPQAATNLTPTPLDYRLGEHIRLTGYALLPVEITPGAILQVALTWETDAPLTENYTVFVQVLDGANHLVGQRDAPPQLPAPDWPIDTPITEGHGVFIEPGTPPGRHRVIVGLYNSDTSQRLPVTGPGEDNAVADFIELNKIDITRPNSPLPPTSFNIQVPLNQPMLEVTLLGYDLYKLGHRSRPDMPLHPGDTVQLVAYWTAQQPVQWLEDQLSIQVVTLSGGESQMVVARQPAGVDYPIKEWQPGEIIRAQYDLGLANIEPGSYRLALTLGVKQSSMQQVVALTKPFRVE